MNSINTEITAACERRLIALPKIHRSFHKFRAIADDHYEMGYSDQSRQQEQQNNCPKRVLQTDSIGPLGPEEFAILAQPDLSAPDQDQGFHSKPTSGCAGYAAAWHSCESARTKPSSES